MVICLERGADLHMAQLMPLSLTVSCSSKIQIGCTFLVPAYVVGGVVVCVLITTASPANNERTDHSAISAGTDLRWPKEPCRAA